MIFSRLPSAYAAVPCRYIHSFPSGISSLLPKIPILPVFQLWKSMPSFSGDAFDLAGTARSGSKYNFCLRVKVSGRLIHSCTEGLPKWSVDASESFAAGNNRVGSTRSNSHQFTSAVSPAGRVISYTFYNWIGSTCGSDLPLAISIGSSGSTAHASTPNIV